MLASPKDVAEVQNAYEIYELLEVLNPYSVEDLLKGHSIMMKGLRDDAGEFREKPVGVVDSSGNIIHFGTLPQYVPQLVGELLEVSSIPVKISKQEKNKKREELIDEYLSKNSDVSNSDVRELLSVSSATANRILKDLADNGVVVRFRKGKT